MVEPLVSVIIPVYNRSEALKRTLDSVVKQTHRNLEILVVDDGSESDIYSVVQELNNVRIYYHKLNHKNANVARNYGIEKCNGEYVAMLDADDIWLENHIESCINRLIESESDGLYGSLILKNNASQSEREIIVRPLNEDETMIDYLLCTGYGAQTSTLFMIAESAKKTLWDPELNRHQDYDFVIRYNKQYKLTPKVNPTVVYILDEEKQLTIDFQSCIKVIKNNENDISPNLYYSYHVKMLYLAKSLNASDDIIEYYKKEVTYYKEVISFYQFLIIRHPQTRYQRLKCKLEYILYILRVRLE